LNTRDVEHEDDDENEYNQVQLKCFDAHASFAPLPFFLNPTVPQFVAMSQAESMGRGLH
jgi:hypothetical protein